MTGQTDHDIMLRDSETRRLLRQEELILEVTEALALALERARVSQAVLARRLGKSRAYVCQILAGGRNLTLRTVADIADALGYRIMVKACRQDRPALTPSMHVAWDKGEQRHRNRNWSHCAEMRIAYPEALNENLEAADFTLGVAV